MANSEHLNILTLGVELWNRWREENPDVKPDLSHANLTGECLPGADFRGSDLRHANLEEVKLNAAAMGSANCGYADMTDAHLEGACLCFADLSNAKMTRTHLTNACMRISTLKDVDLQGADLSNTIIIGANMSNGSLQNCRFSHANLRSVEIVHGWSISTARKYMTDLSSADLSGADFSDADLRDTNLVSANLSNTTFLNADLRDTLFDNAVVKKADFSGAKLTTQKTTGGLFGAASFLTLAGCEGLDTARFSPGALEEYLTQAFAYAHKRGTPESDYVPGFVSDVVRKIKVLRIFIDNVAIPPTCLIEAIDSISIELLRYIKLHPTALYELRPRQFEKLIAEVLASYGWQVRLTPATRDGGYDLFAVSKDISGVKTSWIVECKKYSARRKVGIDVVRALYGIKSDLNVANIMLATTSYFSKDVHAYKASRYDLELKDYDSVLEWIYSYRPGQDGTLHFNDH